MNFRTTLEEWQEKPSVLHTRGNEPEGVYMEGPALPPLPQVLVHSAKGFEPLLKLRDSLFSSIHCSLERKGTKMREQGAVRLRHLWDQLFFLNGKWNHIVNFYFCQARTEKRKPLFSVMKGTCTRQSRENSHGLRRKDETLSQMHLAGWRTHSIELIFSFEFGLVKILPNWIHVEIFKNR